MSIHRALAPAKVNLGLFLGPTRPSDERHELVTVMQSISLADEVTLQPAPAGAVADQLDCDQIAGPPEENLAARGRPTRSSARASRGRRMRTSRCAR